MQTCAKSPTSCNAHTAVIGEIRHHIIITGATYTQCCESMATICCDQMTGTYHYKSK